MTVPIPLKRKITVPGDRALMTTRDFHVPRTRVFDAWTKLELLGRWLTGLVFAWRYDTTASLLASSLENAL